jgi:hypothetical protein
MTRFSSLKSLQIRGRSVFLKEAEYEAKEQVFTSKSQNREREMELSLKDIHGKEGSSLLANPDSES